MSFKIEVVKNRLPDLEILAAVQAAFVCTAGAEATVVDAKKQIEESIGSGKKYPGLPKPSSSPGEAPVDQGGDLLGSIQVGDSEEVIGIGAEVVVSDPVGYYLEFGTSKMAPRPFLGPATVTGEGAVEAAIKISAESFERL